MSKPPEPTSNDLSSSMTSLRNRATTHGLDVNDPTLWHFLVETAVVSAQSRADYRVLENALHAPLLAKADELLAEHAKLHQPTIGLTTEHPPCELFAPRVTRYRIYAGGSIVHQDDFEEHDNSQPYYDDYSEHVVSDELIDFIANS